MKEKNFYPGIEYLRVIACIGIVMMHMISKSNNQYFIKGFLAEIIIPSFTNFVFLFMAISSFGMCVGYYEKVKKGSLDWVDFYKKRYMKVFPFFSVIVFIDIIVEHNLTALIEAVPNLTFTRGLFPNNIEQIGVAWFLGVVFVFYAIFPLFCVLINTKKSGWIFMSISVVLNIILSTQYGIERTNFIYSLPFFAVGGLIFLYVEQIRKISWYYCMPITFIAIVFYYLIGGNVFTYLIVTAALLIQGINFQNNNIIVSFLSSMSMEIYLSHMVMFRIIEKLHLNTFIGNGWLQYCITILLVLVGTICFSFMVKKGINIVTRVTEK